MIYIHQRQTIELYIDVRNGITGEQEDMSNTDVFVYLVRGAQRTIKISLHNISVTDDGKIKCIINALPTGVYKAKVAYIKQGGYPPMVIESKYMFSITEYLHEATNPNADLAKVNVKLRTTGKVIDKEKCDGYSTYQGAVSKGYDGTEDEFYEILANARPVNDLDTDSEVKPLSAAQGKVLNEKIESIKVSSGSGNWFEV